MSDQKPRKSNKPRKRFSDTPLGRPRTKLEDLPDNWQQIMKDAAQSGASNVTLKLLLGIGHSAFETLLADYEIFRETVEVCKMLSEHWHETTGRAMMTGANGNAVAWKFAMQNQFGWSDRQQLIGDPNAPLRTESKVSIPELKLFIKSVVDKV